MNSLIDILARLGIIKKKAIFSQKKVVLLNKIRKAGFPEKEVVVSVDEFFDGNEDIGSIGCNIFPDPPSLGDFYEILKKIELAEKTKTLAIRIADVYDADWFYTDAVYVIGDYNKREINQLFEPLKPDEVYEGLMYGSPANFPGTNNGKSYSIWWD